MTDPDLASFRRRVTALVDEAHSRYAGGHHTAAIERLASACGLVRDRAAAEPADPANPQQLGSMLYTLGEWQLQAGDHAAAVDTLTEAESAYQRLGTLGRRDVVQLLADVAIRRARVHTAAGHPLSAIADVQQAVEPCLAADNGPGDPRRPDIARVMAHAAHLQLQVGGDPDLAVAAADWALREFLTAFRSGDQLSLPAEHAPVVRTAGVVAYIVHTASGRPDLARAARWFATLGADGSVATLDQVAARVVTTQPSLAQVLNEAGRADLAETLTAPATDVRLYVPADRCAPQLAPAYAESLVDLQTGGAVDAAELLLGLEAHALFSAASRNRVPTLRYRFGHFGQQWATAVINYGQRHAENGVAPVALDAARWLTGIVDQLLPQAIVDAGVRRTALACARWQRDIYEAAGDSAAAAGAAEAIAALQRFSG